MAPTTRLLAVALIAVAALLGGAAAAEVVQLTDATFEHHTQAGAFPWKASPPPMPIHPRLIP